jgi:tetratricopeptide (TPR) repeat protein/predicted Ser/Thr protein kinase/TolB-like protein
MVGKTIAHYKILEKLGEGGMGVVFAAEDMRIQRTVAIKVLPQSVPASHEEQERILVEARAAGQLNHPNICAIYAVEEIDDERFIVMEYVKGKTLRELIQSGEVSNEQALDYGIQIVEALQEAHVKEIVHRDIKTENIMVNDRGQVKVMDFGLAKLKGAARLTRTGSTVGTLAYMAPEQIDGRGADLRSDVFSLGVVLYELFTGQYPFRGEHEAAIVYSIMNEDPRPLQEQNPDAPSSLTQILNRALEKDPDARYQTAHEMLIDLRRAGGDPTAIASATVPIPRETAHRPVKKSWLTAVGIAAGIVAIVIAVNLFVLPLFRGDDIADRRIPIAVISFENQTGDPAYDYLRAAIPNLLITSLEQSPSVQVTTWERMRDILRTMGRENVQVIDRDLGFELCRSDTIPYIVVGSVTKGGNVFATDVKVIHIETKETLSSASSRGEGAGSILQHQIDELSRRIVEGIGLSANQFSETARPVADVTTSSMGAYDYYIKGKEAKYTDWDDVTARRMFEKAIALDSTFAIAYAALARSLGDLGVIKERNNAIEMAKQYAHRASEIDRLYIDADYADMVEKDRDKQTRIYERILRSHPNDKKINAELGDHYLGVENDRALMHYEKALEADPDDAEFLNAVGYAHFYQRNYEKALEYFDRYASLSPDQPNPYDSKGEVYFQMGYLDNALSNFKKAIQIRREFLASYMRAAYVHALKEEYGEAMALIDTMISVAPTPALKGMSFHWKAFYTYWLGRREEALNHAQQVKRLAEAAGIRGLAHAPDVLAVWIHYEQDELEEGRKFLDAWEERARNGNPDRLAWRLSYSLAARAVFDMKEGKEDSARARLEAMESLLPEVKTDRNELLFTRDELLSEIFLLQKEYSKCIELSETITVIPLPNIYSSHTVFYNHPFQVDQLARAYEKKGEADSAIAAYDQLIIFDPRSDNRRLINPLYRYRLGLLYEDKGLSDKAVEQYEKFVELWKNAERDRMELPDARSRLRRLKDGI